MRSTAGWHRSHAYVNRSAGTVGKFDWTLPRIPPGATLAEAEPQGDPVLVTMPVLFKNGSRTIRSKLLMIARRFEASGSSPIGPS